MHKIPNASEMTLFTTLQHTVPAVLTDCGFKPKSEYAFKLH